MTQFHSTKELIEHPAFLVEAFTCHGIDLELDDGLSRAVGNVDGESVCIVLYANRFRANLAVFEYPSMFSLRQSSPAGETLSAILFDLGVVTVESTLDEEIQYVENHFEQTQAIKATIRRIRDEEAFKSQMVDKQDFEKAAHHLKQRTTLMDLLYDLCMGAA